MSNVIRPQLAQPKPVFLQLKNISAYTTAFHLSNFAWDRVMHWDFFAKDTIGKQFVRALDSISANIAEGFGRFSKKEKVQFYRYALGSTKEAMDWNEKAKRRNLISESEYEHIFLELSKLPKDIHSLIKFTRNRLTI